MLVPFTAPYIPASTVFVGTTICRYYWRRNTVDQKRNHLRKRLIRRSFSWMVAPRPSAARRRRTPLFSPQPARHLQPPSSVQASVLARRIR